MSAEVSQQKFVSEERPAEADYYMTGVVENTGAVPLAGPEVTVEFYDARGSVISTASTGITHLGKGQFWDVRVEYLGVDEDPKPDSGVIEFGTAEPWSTYSRPEELEIVSETLENTRPSITETKGSPTETTATESTANPTTLTLTEVANTTAETTSDTTETTPMPSEPTTKPLVSGEVRNTGDTSLSAIFVHADFIADNGHVLESGEMSIAELSSGATTSFEIDYPGFDEKRIERVSDYELYVVL